MRRTVWFQKRGRKEESNPNIETDSRKVKRKDKTTFVSFIDLEKAFDSVNWNTFCIIPLQTRSNYRQQRFICRPLQA